MQTQTEQTHDPSARPTSEKPSRAEGPAQEKRVTYLTPAVDVLDGEGEVLIVADVPGVKSENLTIRLEKETLSFVGQRTAPKGGADLAYRRSFTVPREIDVEHIAAELTDGVLTLHLPRHASAKPRQIAVRTK